MSDETLPQKALRAVEDYGHLKDLYAQGAAVGIGKSAVEIMKASLTRAPYIRPRVVEGRLTTMHAVGRAAGLPSIVNRAESSRLGFGEEKAYYGKGDKFNDAVFPLRRYLTVWEKKQFEYAHVPPKEARRRVEIIDGLIRDLEAARVDLAQRSHEATLSFNGKKGSR
jgi:hypothetical protein